MSSTDGQGSGGGGRKGNVKPFPPRRDAKGRPEIRISTQTHDLVDQAIVAIRGDPGIYQRAGRLVRIVDDRPRPLSEATLHEVLTRAAHWTRANAEGEVRAALPPREVTRALRDRGSWGLRELRGVIDAPVLRPDGTVLRERGYDDATGLYLRRSWARMHAPELPTAEDLYYSVEVLREAFVDFPFASEAHLTGAVAAVLTYLARYATAGPRPFVLIDANVTRTGKSLLAQAIGWICTGETPQTRQLVGNDEEQRKQISTLALAGEQIVLLDNANGTIGGAPLEAALTSTVWSDRMLGSLTDTGRLELPSLWVCTSNNASLSSDMVGRTVHVRLESPLEDPTARQVFAHPDLYSYVLDKREEILGAALTVLRAYVAKGQPGLGLRPWGLHGTWDSVVRASRVYAGFADPIEARESLRTECDPVRQHLGELLAAFPRHAVSAPQLIDAAAGSTSLRRALQSLLPERQAWPPTTRSLGRLLARHRGRVVGGRWLQASSGERGGRDGLVWRVSAANPANPEPNPGETRKAYASEIAGETGDSPGFRVSQPTSRRAESEVLNAPGGGGRNPDPGDSTYPHEIVGNAVPGFKTPPNPEETRNGIHTANGQSSCAGGTRKNHNGFDDHIPANGRGKGDVGPPPETPDRPPDWDDDWPEDLA